MGDIDIDGVYGFWWPFWIFNEHLTLYIITNTFTLLLWCKKIDVFTQQWASKLITK